MPHQYQQLWIYPVNLSCWDREAAIRSVGAYLLDTHCLFYGQPPLIGSHT
jgi:hypothetical protein